MLPKKAGLIVHVAIFNSFHQKQKIHIYLTSWWTLPCYAMLHSVLFVDMKCMRDALVVPMAIICRILFCVCSKASVRWAMGYCLRRLFYIYWFLRFGDKRFLLEEKQND